MNSNQYFNSNYNDYIFNQIPTNIIQTQYKIASTTNIPNKNQKNNNSNNYKINNTPLKYNKINTTLDYSNNDYLTLNNKNNLNRYGSQGKISNNNYSKNQIKNQNINKIIQNKFKTIGETIHNKIYHTPELSKRKDHSTIDYSHLGNNMFKKYDVSKTNNKKNLSRPRTPDYNMTNTNNNYNNNKKRTYHIRQKTPERILNRMKLNLNKDLIGNNYERKTAIKNNRNKSNSNLLNNTNYTNNTNNNTNNTLFHNYYQHTKTFSNNNNGKNL